MSTQSAYKEMRDDGDTGSPDAHQESVAVVPTSTEVHLTADVESEEHARRFARILSVPQEERIMLSWNNICAHVTQPMSFFSRRKAAAERKQILRNVTGEVKPSTLLAVMGSSGAGKSTLLNILTNRNLRNLTVTGEVRVNGQNLGSAISNVSAYVQQDDLFIGLMTVREHLHFQAELKMGGDVTAEERLDRVHAVMTELSLGDCANTLIGFPGGRVKGISGGERKRLAFASEVLTNPRLLFCDEPTSGLDSFMAQNVVSVLRKMAAKGRTIICTIHQPSSEIYAMFDRLLLMADGRVAFQGTKKDAVEFFASQGYVCPPNFNPADFLIHSMAVIPGKEETCKQNIAKVAESFAESENQVALLKRLRSETGSPTGDIIEGTSGSGNGLDESPYKVGVLRQMKTVLWRCWLCTWRDPLLQRVRIIQTIINALLLGIIYLQVDNNQEGIMNVNGALFLFLTNMTFQNTFAVITLICEEVPVFFREHFNGLYSTFVYYLCKTSVDVLPFIFYPVLFSAVAYYMIGLYSSFEAFATNVGIMVMVTSAAVSFGYMVSAISKNHNVALAVAPPLIIPIMLFGGFFLNVNSVPVYFVWLEYLSWFRYGAEDLFITQWKDVTSIECNKPAVVNGSDNLGCVKNGTQVLSMLNFNEDRFWPNIYGLIGLTIGYRVIGFFGLLLRTYRATGK